jgi:FkbM family methyltransferase
MFFKRLFQKLGIDLRFYPTKQIKSRQSFMKKCQFDVVLDIGANIGQFVSEIRNEYSFSGKIISFEPITAVFSELEKNCKNDKNWIGYNFALGNKSCTEIINISKHAPSSSIRQFNEDYISDKLSLVTTDQEEIQVKKLNEIFPELNLDSGSKILLKVDTQGYEMDVLKGCGELLNCFHGIQIECSIRELYIGEALYLDVFDFLQKNNFHLFTLEPSYYDKKTMELLQIDAYFIRKNV